MATFTSKEILEKLMALVRQAVMDNYNPLKGVIPFGARQLDNTVTLQWPWAQLTQEKVNGGGYHIQITVTTRATEEGIIVCTSGYVYMYGCNGIPKLNPFGTPQLQSFVECFSNKSEDLSAMFKRLHPKKEAPPQECSPAVLSPALIIPEWYDKGDTSEQCLGLAVDSIYRQLVQYRKPLVTLFYLFNCPERHVHNLGSGFDEILKLVSNFDCFAETTSKYSPELVKRYLEEKLTKQRVYQLKELAELYREGFEGCSFSRFQYALQLIQNVLAMSHPKLKQYACEIVHQLEENGNHSNICILYVSGTEKQHKSRKEHFTVLVAWQLFWLFTSDDQRKHVILGDCEDKFTRNMPSYLGIALNSVISSLLNPPSQYKLSQLFYLFSKILGKLQKQKHVYPQQ